MPNLSTNACCWLWLFLALGIMVIVVLTIGVMRAGILC